MHFRHASGASALSPIHPPNRPPTLSGPPLACPPLFHAADFRMYRETPAGKKQETAAPTGEEEGKGTDGGPATVGGKDGGSSSPEDQAVQVAPMEQDAAAAGEQQAAQAAPQAAEAAQKTDETGDAAPRQAGSAAAAAAGPKHEEGVADRPTPEQEVAAGAGSMKQEAAAATGPVKQEAAAAGGDVKQDAVPAPPAAGAAAPAMAERKAELRAAPTAPPTAAAAAAAAAALAQPWAAAMAALPGGAALPQPWAAAAAAMAAAAARSGATVPWGIGQWQAAMGLAAQQQQDDDEEEEEEGETWAEQRERLLSYRVPEDPEPEVRWELVASTLQEFEVRGAEARGAYMAVLSVAVGGSRRGCKCTNPSRPEAMAVCAHRQGLLHAAAHSTLHGLLPRTYHLVAALPGMLCLADHPTCL